MLFLENKNHEEVLNALSTDREYFDLVIAMANLGSSFSAICVLEDQVSALVLTSKAKLSSKLDATAVSAGDLFLEKHSKVQQATLGRLVTVLEDSGIRGREISYLRAIVDIRNDFVHRLMTQVPLPGDWHRYNYDIERFSGYTKFVLRHMNFAIRSLPRILVKYGLLEGTFGDFGALLMNPDENPFNG